MSEIESPNRRRRRGDAAGIAVAAAAYAGFAAFALLHPSGAAHAGLPLDKVREAAEHGQRVVAQAPGEAPRGVRTGEAGGATLQFVVKLEGETAAEWGRRFSADPSAARKAWAEQARTSAAFSGLALSAMNPYSGIATLELEGAAPADPAAMQKLSDDIVRRLSGADGVEYAEPNIVGGREKIREGIQ